LSSFGFAMIALCFRYDCAKNYFYEIEVIYDRL